MTIGIIRLSLFIQGSHSLKEKRMILHSFKARLRNNFNLAVTQIADEDKWQKATLGIVGIERNNQTMNSILSRTINFVESFNQVSLIDYEIELL